MGFFVFAVAQGRYCIQRVGYRLVITRKIWPDFDHYFTTKKGGSAWSSPHLRRSSKASVILHGRERRSSSATALHIICRGRIVYRPGNRQTNGNFVPLGGGRVLIITTNRPFSTFRARLDQPLAIRNRNIRSAVSDDRLKNSKPPPPATLFRVVHGFDGPWRHVRQGIDEGLLKSIPP